MEELLFVFGHDSFKAPALNTLSRSFELRDFIERAIDNKKTKPILAIVEELRWSIHNDPAIDALHTRKIIFSLLDSIVLATNSNQTNELKNAVSQANTISLSIGDYRRILENKLREFTPSGTDKAAITSLAASYVVQLENEGFSKRFLQYQVSQLLTKPFAQAKTIDPIIALDSFFASFNNKAKKFNVYFRSSDEIATLPAESPFTKVEPPGRPAKHAQIDDPLLAQLMALKEVDARDPIKARDKAFQLVRTYASVSKYFSHGLELRTGSNFIVQDLDEKTELVVKPPVSAMLRGTEKQSKEITEQQTMELSRAIQRLSPSSRQFLFNALQYHKEALDSQSLENQLVDLWAAIEGFVPQPIDDRPRLNHYLESMLPTLTLIYPEKIFGYLSNALFHSSPAIRTRISGIKIDGSFANKTTALILCSEFKTECDAVCNLLDSHPLLRYRMFRTYEAFSSPEKLQRTLASHRTKLAWHLGRIYNTRNTIMHTASALPYLETLVENLHSYVDHLLSTTIHVAANCARGTTIKSVLNLISAYESHHQDMLSEASINKTKIDASNFSALVFGAGNPICRI